MDDWFSGERYSFAKYNSELGMLHRDRRYKEGINDSYCIYSYDDQDARRGYLYADQPCHIHVYGRAFAGGEQVSDGETWEEALAAHLCEPVKNFGVGGFSTYTAYLRMKQVERQDPAPYIIFNLAKGDHGFNLIGWLRLMFRSDTDKAFHTTMPYVEVDPEKRLFMEYPNPCPTEKSIHNLCNADWLYERFQGDYVFNYLYQNKKVQDAARRMITTTSIENPLDRDGEFLLERFISPEFSEKGHYDTM